LSLVSVSDLLAGGRSDDHCVAILDGRRINLSRFRSDVFHNAEWLSDSSVRRGAVVCEHGYWFIVGILSLVKIGAEVILPPNAQDGTLRSIAGDVDAIVVDSGSAAVPKRYVLQSSSDVVASFRTDLKNGNIHFFTSGSTGEMKAVKKSITMFEREASVLENMWGTELQEIPVVGTVTHQHVFGMTFRIIWPLTAGRPFHSEFHMAWEGLHAQLDGPTMIVTSPAQLTRLGGLAAVAENNRPRRIITAGAPLPSEAARDSSAIFGCAPTEILGSTEAGVIAWRHSGTGPAVWQPFPTVEVEANAEGVMLLRSAHASTPGWSLQSDKIQLDGDGRFRLLGRIDRILKIEGKRVSLQRLERELCELVWVKEAAVVGLGGSRPYLGTVVQLSEAGAVEIERLGKFRFERKLRRELSWMEDLAVLPRRWRFVDFMPTDQLGKRRVNDVVTLLEQNE
jgi:acyl-coenzyme A synthetase/AMP-(fatty) acid ligase